MSKKYIITIKSEYEDTTRGIMVLGARDSNLFVDTVTLDDLEELNSDYINENFGELQDTAYQKGFDDAHRISEEEYQRGFEDGKAVNDKGCEGCKYGGTPQGSSPCFNCSNYYKNNWTAKDDKIEVGDEVKHKSEGVTWTAVVTRIRCGTLTLMGHSGVSADNYPIEDFVKTGRHFDIASILEAMKK